MSVPDGFIKTDEECSKCEDGAIWKGNTEALCDSCYATKHGHDKPRRSMTKWEKFRANRPTYPGSGKKKCVGGFLDPYNWGEDDGNFRY